MLVTDMCKVFTLVLQGETFLSIGYAYGVSGSYISQIFYRMSKILKHPYHMPAFASDQEQIAFKENKKVNDFRVNKTFWLKLLDRYKETQERVGTNKIPPITLTSKIGYFALIYLEDSNLIKHPIKKGVLREDIKLAEKDVKRFVRTHGNNYMFGIHTVEATEFKRILP